ncbi:hypothetical protein AURDEDRAFT_49692 [Auricularia subglabra TFB-10046 SS5]|nr:hypothetical protein AURDEDRAFT_49692 [Auricularia subglabra TFB-10046 SS5]
MQPLRESSPALHCNYSHVWVSETLRSRAKRRRIDRDCSAVSISCVCVGIGAGGTTPMLARICIVDGAGNALFNAYVKPTMPVVDYRTASTGITAGHLSSSAAVPFATVQRSVSQIIRGRPLVGHKSFSSYMVAQVLGIAHPATLTRDVALYMPYRNALRAPNHIFELPELVSNFMMRRIGTSGEDPTENARASLDLYRASATQWENAVVANQWPSALPPDAYSRCYI